MHHDENRASTSRISAETRTEGFDYLYLSLHIPSHITHLPTSTPSIDQSNYSPGFLNFELTKRLSFDSEDGFRTGC